MITIDTDTIWDIALLDDIARTVLGVDTVGVSVGVVSSIHLVNEVQTVQDMAHAIFDGYNVLSVTAEATGQALTCTCDDPAIANDAELGYLVLRDGAVYATDLVAVTDGSASITLVDPIAGVYDLIMYRVVGDYRSAVAGLVVHEATA